MRDAQRQRVYNWESKEFNLDKRSSLTIWWLCNGNRQRYMAFWRANRMSLEACRSLLQLVWLRHAGQSTPPEVLDGRGRKSACGGFVSIALPWWSRQRVIVLHEIAHSIHSACCIEAKVPLSSQEPHGPQFVAWYIKLLAEFGNAGKTEAQLAASARAAGLRLLPLEAEIVAAMKPEKGVLRC